MSHFTLEFVSEHGRKRLRISRSMLELEHIFELGNLYSLRFIESDSCLPLFEYETHGALSKFIFGFLEKKLTLQNPLSRICCKPEREHAGKLNSGSYEM